MFLAFALLQLLLEYLAATAFWLSVAVSLIHAGEELAAGPLWRYFHQLGGPRVSDRVGLALFFFGLVGALSIVSWFAYDGAYTWSHGGLPARPWAVGLLLGLRLGDAALSHWALAWWRPGLDNPGLRSTALYVVEAAWLVNVGPAWCWVWVGAAAFWVVNPVFGAWPIGRALLRGVHHGQG